MTQKSNINTRVHGIVAYIFAGLCLFILICFASIFTSDGETEFMIAICGFYLLMYLGGPYMMLKVSGQKLMDGTDFHVFLSAPFQTATGTITGGQALFQICIVPSAVALTSFIVAIIISIRM